MGFEWKIETDNNCGERHGIYERELHTHMQINPRRRAHQGGGGTDSS